MNMENDCVEVQQHWQKHSLTILFCFHSPRSSCRIVSFHRMKYGVKTLYTYIICVFSRAAM